MRRVVVTGLGAITPLGVGVQRSWSRLLAGESGIGNLARFWQPREWRELPSTVAGIVPKGSADTGGWRPEDWQFSSDPRRMALFTQYANGAAQMALEDAAWNPTEQEGREATGVCIGSGIGNMDDMYSMSITYEKYVGYATLSLRILVSSS